VTDTSRRTVRDDNGRSYTFDCRVAVKARRSRPSVLHSSLKHTQPPYAVNVVENERRTFYTVYRPTTIRRCGLSYNNNRPTPIYWACVDDSQQPTRVKRRYTTIHTPCFKKNIHSYYWL